MPVVVKQNAIKLRHGSVPTVKCHLDFARQCGRNMRDSASCRRLRNIVSDFICKFYTACCLSPFLLFFSDFPSTFGVRNYTFKLISRSRERIIFVFLPILIHVGNTRDHRVYDKNNMRYQVIDEIIRCKHDTISQRFENCAAVVWYRAQIRVMPLYGVGGILFISESQDNSCV